MPVHISEFDEKERLCGASRVRESCFISVLTEADGSASGTRFTERSSYG